MAKLQLGAWLAVFLAVVVAVSGPVAADGGLRPGFYFNSCPNVEHIVYNSMASSYSQDKTVAPGVLRMSFHDCFVRGCDASVLLDGADTEKHSIINGNLHGFEAIDAAKAAVESACPGVVSCADILQFAARDSVRLTGGQGWPVPAGRRDGTVSKSSEPIQNLPAPHMKVPELLPFFEKKGLNAAQMAALSGAHTIGISHCPFISDRLYTFNSPSKVDPSLPASFAASLKRQCPSSTSTNAVNLDLVSPGRFDSQYYKNILHSLGLLTSDQSMLDDARTSAEISSDSGGAFGGKFASAMVAMSSVGVLTGTNGQIRQNCRQVK